MWEIILPEEHATAVAETGGATPEVDALSQNYPNPFNPETTIPYDVRATGDVELVIFDLAGQRIRTLVHGRQTAGRYSAHWDGRDYNGVDVASGVYLYRLRTEFVAVSRRLTLVK